MIIGFIGQGFIGKHMADDCESRGFAVVRYALEPAYADNRDAIASCDIVFIAVPTPTTPSGFDSSILEAVVPLVGVGNIAVIKSTVVPGTTERLQEKFPDRVMLHAPEFLREKFAAEDTAHPARTIIGMPVIDSTHTTAVEKVLTVLPKAPYELVCKSETAELIKYGGNCFLAQKVVFMNLLYDAARACGADYAEIAAAMAADERIGTSHMKVIDESGHPGSMPGRGAGGHCFPKDLAAFASWYQRSVHDDTDGTALLRALEAKNNVLLRTSKKDLDLLDGIYG
jgi:UDPglucose 6-dehydrogenase